MTLHVNRRKAERTVALILLLIGWLYIGFTIGYWQGTGLSPFHGSFPWQNNSVGLPPATVGNVSADEVQSEITVLQDKEYGVGYNCLDYAWDAVRLLRWDGHTANVVALRLDPEPNHAIIIVATDNGWIFMEPQTGEVVTPRVGGKYGNFQTIEAIEVMEVHWVSLDYYLNMVEWSQNKE